MFNSSSYPEKNCSEFFVCLPGREKASSSLLFYFTPNHIPENISTRRYAQNQIIHILNKARKIKE
jgi:hypothetical protein